MAKTRRYASVSCLSAHDGGKQHAGEVFENTNGVHWPFHAWNMVMLDIPDIYRPKLVTPRCFEWHLFLRFVGAFGLVPAVKSAVFCHDAPTGARGDLDAHLQQGGVHAPGTNERIGL